MDLSDTVAAAQLIAFMLDFVLRNCERCNVEDDVRLVVQDVIRYRPVVTGPLVLVHDEDIFGALYCNMHKSIAHSIKTLNDEDAYILEDAMMTASYRMSNALATLYPGRLFAMS